MLRLDRMLVTLGKGSRSEMQKAIRGGRASLLAAGGLAGCAAAVLGGAAAVGTLATVERRGAQTRIDDQGIELRADNQVKALIGERGRVNIVSYYRKVLLTGEVPTEDDRRRVQAAVAALPPYRAAAPDLMPFYIGFTSGSSGQPKGFRRHHRSWVESFAITAQTFGAQLTGPVLAPGRISHSLFLFAAMLGLWTGRGARVQEKFSAETTWAQLQQAPGSTLVAVPSQLLLLMQMAQRKGWAPLAQPSLVLISGARWMREHTPQLQALVPQARVTEFYGASEASYITWMDVAERAHPQTVGQPFGNVQLRIGPTPHRSLPVGEVGRIWLRSPMLFMDYVHALDGSAAELHDGWLTVRDMGWLDAAGQLYLCGRESRMLVTQGKNLFPEEVEAWLLAQPGVAQASVIGLPDALRGLRIHAVLHGTDLPAATALAAGCRAQLEAFKTPRRWWRWQGAWPQTRSGKTDTATLQAAVAQALAGQQPAALQPWR